MVAVAWAAIALVAVGQGLLATALFQLRGELRSELGGVRSEIGGLRSELRSEMRGGFAELRGEIAELRGEMREGFRAQGARLDAHIDRHAG